MRLIIAGTRTYHPTVQDLDKYVMGFEATFNKKATRLVCGMAPGVDTAALEWARIWNMPVDEYPADWEAQGRAAGPLRNKLMAENADGLLLIWDGQSPGSKSMRMFAQLKGLYIYEVIT